MIGLYLTPQTTRLADHVISSPLPEELPEKLHILSSPAAGCRSILIGQNVDFEFLIDRSKELK